MEQNVLDKIIVLYVNTNRMRVDEAARWFDNVCDKVDELDAKVPIIMLPDGISLSVCDYDELIIWRDTVEKFIAMIDQERHDRESISDNG